MVTPTSEQALGSAPEATTTGAAQRVAKAAKHLYEAECALHVAHQTRVDAWITAAADRLHEAVLELDRAERELADDDAVNLAA